MIRSIARIIRANSQQDAQIRRPAQRMGRAIAGMASNRLGWRIRARTCRAVLWGSIGLFLAGSAALLGCSGRESPWTEERSPGPTIEAPSSAPDILIVLVDALRPDHLGCYGYVRPTSPFLDRWSAGAAQFNE